MATELATAYIALVPSAKGIKGNIESELGGAGTTAASKTEAAFGKSARNVGSVLKGALIGAAAGGAAAFGAIKVGNELLSIGARVESFRQKSKTVFEGQSDDVRKWADKNNESFGVTDDELTGLAANFGDLLKPMGFTSAEAAKMSTDVVGLSGALSSWSGGTLSASDASVTLAKAMLGERDGLKALGISISEADVQAKLAEKGQQDLTGAALEQAKAVATQELIFAKSADAQKAWADGGNKALVGQNKLKAAVGEAKESIATALTPALTAAAGWLGDRLPGAIAAAQGWFRSIQPTLQQVAAWLQEKIPPAVEVLRGAFAQVVDWVRANWPEIRDTIAGVLSAVQTVIESVVSVSLTIWKNFGDNVLAYVKAVWGPVQSVISGAMDIIKGIFSTVAALLKGDWGAVWDGIKQTVSGAFEFITGIFGVFREAVKLWVGIVTEILSSIWSKAWDGIKTITSAAIGAVVGFVTGIPSRIASTVATLWDGIKTGITIAKDWARDRISDLVALVVGIPARIVATISSLWDGLKDGIRIAKDFVKARIDEQVAFVTGMPGRVAATFASLWNALKDGARIAKDFVKARIDDVVGFVTGMPAKISATASGMFDGIKEAFRSALNWVIRAWNRLEFKIPGFKIGPVGYDGFTLGLPDIPEFHTGGTVPGPAGREVAIKALAGERVLTAAQAKAYDAGVGGGGRGGAGVTFEEGAVQVDARGVQADQVGDLASRVIGYRVARRIRTTRK